MLMSTIGLIQAVKMPFLGQFTRLIEVTLFTCVPWIHKNVLCYIVAIYFPNFQHAVLNQITHPSTRLNQGHCRFITIFSAAHIFCAL